MVVVVVWSWLVLEYVVFKDGCQFQKKKKMAVVFHEMKMAVGFHSCEVDFCFCGCSLGKSG